VGYTNTRLLQLADYLTVVVTFQLCRDTGLPRFKQGNLLGFCRWHEPKITDSTIVPQTLTLMLIEDDDTSLHIEGFYQFQLDLDNIAITPGPRIVPILNNDNDDIGNDPNKYLLSSLVGIP